ncbi:hypothetical protein H0E90_26795 [Klebsiella pneumoniae]|nr:hypothetical protein [Klebsiella pneumoniae]QLI92900.1 hypothetical protein H0E90_26795 [Klebsiella pneumoniae]
MLILSSAFTGECVGDRRCGGVDVALVMVLCQPRRPGEIEQAVGRLVGVRWRRQKMPAQGDQLLVPVTPDADQ